MRNSNKRILKDFHKKYIDRLVESQYMNKITTSSIKKKLGEQFEDLKSVSKSTIIRWLKKDLNCSYKKMTRKPEPALTPESLGKVLEVAVIQQKLYAKGIEVIYVDEFSVNTRHHQFHGWSKRGHKGLLKIQRNDFSMSFIWAVSNIKVYGILGNQGSNKSNEFKYYLRQLLDCRNADPEFKKVPFIMMYDNSGIHTSDEVKEFISKSKLRSISITPYSPMLNPCEKLIAAVKSNLKKLQSEGR